MAHDSQIIRAKENLKLSHSGFIYRYASGTNPPIKALRQSRQRVWGLTHRRAIKEETIAINWFVVVWFCPKSQQTTIGTSSRTDMDWDRYLLLKLFY